MIHDDINIGDTIGRGSGTCYKAIELTKKCVIAVPINVLGYPVLLTKRYWYEQREMDYEYDHATGELS